MITFLNDGQQETNVCCIYIDIFTPQAIQHFDKIFH